MKRILLAATLFILVMVIGVAAQQPITPPISTPSPDQLTITETDLFARIGRLVVQVELQNTQITTLRQRINDLTRELADERAKSLKSPILTPAPSK